MHRRLQFGMRENTAPSRQHASRLTGSVKSDSNCLEQGSKHTSGTAAPSSVEANEPAHAARHRAATGGERGEASEFSTSESALTHSRMSERAFEPLINSPEAAKLLGDIHVKTLLRYARQGILPGYRVGGHWYFRASELDAWLRSQINSSCHPCR